jgi:hypothetical protein
MKNVALFTCAWLASSAATQAALTTILDSPDQFNEPNLIGVNPFPFNPNPSILQTLYGESNLRRVNDSHDVAFRHTGSQASVKAVARFNNPSIEERFTYSSPSGASWPIALRFERVPPSFGYPVGYTLPTTGSGIIPLADSGEFFEVRLASYSYSDPSKNFGGQDKMVTFEITGNVDRPANQIGNFVLAFEVFTNDDLDFNDVVFELGGVTPIAEPMTAGLWAVPVAWLASRRRRERAAIKSIRRLAERS